MNVTFRQLRVFLALADTGSVTGAARVMHVTQPTASMQLRELTRSIGLPLYDVVSRRVHLTETGRELVRIGRQMTANWDAFEQYVDGVRGHTRGRLSVAVVSTAKYFVPRLLGTFCELHPEVEISLDVLNRDGVLARLNENRDDLYVMSMPPDDPSIQKEPFLSNPLVVLAQSSHPLARRRSIALTSLATEKFILRERGSGTRMVADAHFKRHRLRPAVRLELGSNEAIREAVAGGLGIAVLSRRALPAVLSEHGLVELRVEGFPLQAEWYVVYPRAKRLSPIAEIFRNHLLATDATPPRSG
jgi:LysR family transcriptional regulator, low CO2-responsive transcriptional regulator